MTIKNEIFPNYLPDSNHSIRPPVLVTGGFDPLHSGHIDYFNAAKELGEILIVGLNSDDWLSRKKGQPFMPFDERKAILQALEVVDYVLQFDDEDESSCTAIEEVIKLFGNCTFANGGVRTNFNIPEVSNFANDERVSFDFGVGGDKRNSSSWILKEWKNPIVEREWGHYRVLYDIPGVKVKELVVNPQSKLSMQRHKHRAEYWFVSEGLATVYRHFHYIREGNPMKVARLSEKDQCVIYENQWHQLANESDEPCKVIEIQYGGDCSEDDIERMENQIDFGDLHAYL